MPAKVPRIVTSISLDVETRALLEKWRRKLDRGRSWVVRELIKALEDGKVTL